MPPVVVRRPHRKSRTGCANCKKRKIKCDEQKPICRNCTHHELLCDYLDSTPSLSPPCAHSPAATLSPVFQSQSLNMVHLELLYNYCTTTCYTLTWNQTLKTLYQTSFLKIGFECDYVMYSILALSALHLARLRPSQEQFYVSQAMDLHRESLVLASPALTKVTLDNCVYLFLFSILTFIFEVAQPRESNKTGLGEWLVMFRGTRIVFELSNSELLVNGILGPLIKTGQRRAKIQDSSSSEVDHLWMLQDTINKTSSSDEDLRTFNITIDKLRRCFNIVYNQDPYTYEATDIFIWMHRLSDAFLTLLNEQRPEALAIFAYWCVLLKQLDTRWWAQGWSTHLISQIYNMLDEDHRLWITWPIREIGWIP